MNRFFWLCLILLHLAAQALLLSLAWRLDGVGLSSIIVVGSLCLIAFFARKRTVFSSLMLAVPLVFLLIAVTGAGLLYDGTCGPECMMHCPPAERCSVWEFLAGGGWQIRLVALLFAFGNLAWLAVAMVLNLTSGVIGERIKRR